VIEICKHCKGTGKIDAFDPVSGSYIKGLICQCLCELGNGKIKAGKEKELTTA
jgi:hypothetical protein